MILPIFIIICARKRKTIEIDETTEVDGVMKRDTFIEKLHYNLLNGLKQTTIPSLYPTFAMLKRLAIALTVLLPENKYVQIGLFSGIHVMFVVYLCIARPFVASFYNIMIIINELVMIAIIAMMYSFLSEGDPKDGIGMAINILVIINIILIFAASLIFEIYVLCFKKNKTRNPIVESVSLGPTSRGRLAATPNIYENPRNNKEIPEKVVSLAKIDQKKQESNEKLDEEVAEELEDVENL